MPLQKIVYETLWARVEAKNLIPIFVIFIGEATLDRVAVPGIASIASRHLLLSTPGRKPFRRHSVLPFRIFFMAIDQFNNSFSRDGPAKRWRPSSERGPPESNGNPRGDEGGKPFPTRCANIPFYSLFFFYILYSSFFLFLRSELFSIWMVARTMCPCNLFLLSAMCELLSTICCKFKVLKGFEEKCQATH